MIIARTPFRISFVGGCSDVSEFYREEHGGVVSTTIDKYIYLSMHPLFYKKGYHLKYYENEIVDNIDQIKHPIIRQVFSNYNISGVDFNSSSDVPSGTGLGSSSSFTVGLINLCNAYKGTFISKMDIAKEACNVEINQLKTRIGKQDQYAAACGGLNYIQFNSDESVVVERLPLSPEVKTQLESSLLLFYLGGSRKTALILDGSWGPSYVKNIVRNLVRLAEVLRDDLKANNIDNVGDILDEGWNYKKELSHKISTLEIDNIYKKALRHGAAGGKLLGAGGTGFLLLRVPQDRQEEVRKALNLYELPFKFDDAGTTIIY
jgi:D-glycero-alpha-D-manno-heptose-7-phosphate kinase